MCIGEKKCVIIVVQICSKEHADDFFKYSTADWPKQLKTGQGSKPLTEYVNKFDRKLHKFNHFRTKADSFRKNYRKKKGAYEPASNVLHSGLAPKTFPKHFPFGFQ